MSKSVKYFLFALTFVLMGLLIGFYVKDNVGGSTRISSDQGLKKLQQSLYFIENNYVEEPQRTQLIEEAIQGITDNLDPHSFYIPAKEMVQMQEQMEGSFEGIGIQFNILEDTIYVETPLSGGPSEKIGIKAGDRIIQVNGETVAGIGITNTQVMKYLKGEKGSQVNLAIARRGQSDLLSFTVTRDRIPLNSVEYSYMITDQIGYIRVSRFAETTYKEFIQSLKRLQTEGMSHLILDLRNNPGGYMTKAIHMADDFLSPGKVIVSTEGRRPESAEKFQSTSSYDAFEKGGLIVLLDYGSASASEIVAGAVQDQDRGLIVGVRSFGKGLVQIQEEFDDGSALRLVVSKYYTPSGRCIQKPYHKSSAEYEKEILERFQSGEIFDESKISFPDSLKYRTANGRTVYGGGGIYPDVFVADDTTGSSSYLTQLQINDLFRRFAIDYVDKHSGLGKLYPNAASFASDFDISSSISSAFFSFASDKGIDYSSKDLSTSKTLIMTQLKAMIGRRLFNDDGFYPIIHKQDRVLQRAIELMPMAIELSETGELQMAEKG